MCDLRNKKARINVLRTSAAPVRIYNQQEYNRMIKMKSKVMNGAEVSVCAFALATLFAFT